MVEANESQPDEPVTPPEGETAPEKPVEAASDSSPEETPEDAAPDDAAPSEETDGNEAEKAEATEDPYPDLALGDDTLLDEDVLGQVKAWAKENGLDGKQAQALLELNESARAEAAEYSLKQTDGWKDEIKKDLGTDLDAATKLADSVVLKFARDPVEFQSKIADSGLGFYPPFFHMLHAIGKAMSEGTKNIGEPVTPKKGALTPDEQEDKLWGLFGDGTERPSKRIAQAQTA